MATSGFQRSWVHIHSIILRALRQRATHNIDMAVEPEEGVKLAHGRLQSTLPVRAKTRRQTITSDGTPGLLCLSNPGRRQKAIYFSFTGSFFAAIEVLVKAEQDFYREKWQKRIEREKGRLTSL